MAKYSNKRARKIFSLIEKDSYTIAEICASVGISERCFYDWKAENAEFADGITRARETFTRKSLVECERSLTKLICGYEYEESKTVMVNDPAGRPTIKEKTIMKKKVAPNLGAIIHYQTNKDPENWKNKQSTELTGRDGRDLFEGVTNEELEAKIAELEKKINPDGKV